MLIRYMNGSNNPGFPIIVHSHLRWDFVWQRPQQILSRLAKSHPILFVEEPLHDIKDSSPRFELSEAYPNVLRAIPHLPSALVHDYHQSALAIRQLLQNLIGYGGTLYSKFVDSIQWFYTPMPAPVMLGHLNEIGVVYDCMDELAQFRHAPKDICTREKLLLSKADVVFTGGRKLYESKSQFHHNVHFFGCGVDVAHFGKARLSQTKTPSDLSQIKNPILGYFGVIDERLDYQLLAHLAENQDWSIVMVGPVVKVNPDDLPKAENIHWLGQRDYKDLPAYVKAFNVCLMPFALNEATEYINPTKTLEYMAAGKPIVSTPISDVVSNFTPVVQIADTHEAFAQTAKHILQGADRTMIGKGVEMAKNSSWDATVDQMEALIFEAVLPEEENLDVAVDAKSMEYGDIRTTRDHI